MILYSIWSLSPGSWLVIIVLRTDWETQTPQIRFPLQLGQLIMYYTPKKVWPFAFFYLTRSSKTGKESFLRQILLSDLRFDTYEWKQTKIWMIFKLKSWGVLILKCVVFLVNGKLFLENGKPFMNKSHISCGFFKYAWCILKQLLLEVTYQMLKHLL